MGKFLLGMIAAIALALAGGLAYVYSGSYDIASTSPHGPFERWLLETTMEQSVRSHAESVTPATIPAGARIERGARHFSETCVQCHGSPGMVRGEPGKGLTPTPPDLSIAAAEWSDAELFWIVQNGIKFTGMPAFGPTHSVEELWSLVAFLRRLPSMSDGEYQALVEKTTQASGSHRGGAPPTESERKSSSMEPPHHGRPAGRAGGENPRPENTSPQHRPRASRGSQVGAPARPRGQEEPA